MLRFGEVVHKLRWLKTNFCPEKACWLHPILPSFPLQNYALFIVTPASGLWAELNFFFSLNFGRLRSYFSSFG
jgi:hypothetical protein